MDIEIEQKSVLPSFQFRQKKCLRVSAMSYGSVLSSGYCLYRFSVWIMHVSPCGHVGFLRFPQVSSHFKKHADWRSHSSKFSLAMNNAAYTVTQRSKTNVEESAVRLFPHTQVHKCPQLASTISCLTFQLAHTTSPSITELHLLCWIDIRLIWGLSRKRRRAAQLCSNRGRSLFLGNKKCKLMLKIKKQLLSIQLVMTTLQTCL